MADVAPSESKVQQESITFNRPTSEASMTSIAALANAMREIMVPVGTVVWSMLTESQFHTQNTVTTRWVLADGRAVVGSQYQSITGSSTVPDLRGVVPRGKNNGRSGATGNPDGDVALGTYQADVFASHNHSFSDPGHTHTPNFAGTGGALPYLRSSAYNGGSNISAVDAAGGNQLINTTNSTGITFAANGGNETRMRNVTLNAFIRVN
jgi:hypothetical protein